MSTRRLIVLVLAASFIGWWACPVRGYAAEPTLTVNRHGVAHVNGLAWCRIEDGGPLPCQRVTLNKPRSYWIGGRGVTHYVWPADPLRMFPSWHYRTSSPDAKCITHAGETLCPWGWTG